MWLHKFKIAVIEKDVDTLIGLMDEVPQLEKKEDLSSAVCLLQEATDLVNSLKNEAQDSMIQIKNNLKFLKATQDTLSSKLDLKS